MTTETGPTELVLTKTYSRASHQVAATCMPVLSAQFEPRPEPSGPDMEGGCQENDDYPEGGLRAWLVVFGSFLAMFACFGLMNTAGTLQTELQAGPLKDVSEGSIGWIFGVYTFISFLGGIQIGPIMDVYGPTWLLVSGGICLVSGLVLLSISTAYWHFMVTFGVLCGLGTSAIFTPSITCIGHWFYQRRAFATGIAATGGSVGGIIFPLTLQACSKRIGFMWGIRIVSLIMFTAICASVLLCKSRDKISEKASKKGSPFKAAKIDLSAFNDLRFAFTTLGIFMIEWALFVPLTYITSYAISEGVDETLSYQLLVVLNVGSVFGRWLPGLVADKVGRFNTMITTVTFCFITVLCLWLPASYLGDKGSGLKALLIVFCLFYGFGSGTGIGLTPVCVSQICETKDYGKRYGTCYSVVSFAALTGVPIAGMIKSQAGNYTGLIIFCGFAYLAALFSFTAARYVGVGLRFKAVY